VHAHIHDVPDAAITEDLSAVYLRSAGRWRREHRSSRRTAVLVIATRAHIDGYRAPRDLELQSPSPSPRSRAAAQVRARCRPPRTHVDRWRHLPDNREFPVRHFQSGWTHGGTGNPSYSGVTSSATCGLATKWPARSRAPAPSSTRPRACLPSRNGTGGSRYGWCLALGVHAGGRADLGQASAHPAVPGGCGGL